MAPDEDPFIRYSTKEVLADIKHTVDSIMASLAKKADQERVQNHEARLVELEKSDAIYLNQSKDRRFLYGAILTLIGALVGVGGIILVIAK